jgi:hypothetical protein
VDGLVVLTFLGALVALVQITVEATFIMPQ